MRRIIGVLASAVLALALSYASAAAAGLSFGRPSGDLASQLMLSLFGETSDSTAAFSAQNGDRASESPLRDMALRLPAAGPSVAFSLSLIHIWPFRGRRATSGLGSLPRIGRSHSLLTMCAWTYRRARVDGESGFVAQRRRVGSRPSRHGERRRRCGRRSRRGFRSRSGYEGTLVPPATTRSARRCAGRYRG